MEYKIKLFLHPSGLSCIPHAGEQCCRGPRTESKQTTCLCRHSVLKILTEMGRTKAVFVFISAVLPGSHKDEWGQDLALCDLNCLSKIESWCCIYLKCEITLLVQGSSFSGKKIRLVLQQAFFGISVGCYELNFPRDVFCGTYYFHVIWILPPLVLAIHSSFC